MEENIKNIDSFENPLGYEPVKKLLMKFAVPAVISILVNSLYNVVDQIFIGQGVGYKGNAATTVAFPLVTITLALSMLFGSGAAAYAAIKLGEGKDEVAEKVLNNSFVILTMVGIIVTAIGIIFLKPMLYLFGAADSFMQYAVDYTFIILLGTPFMVVGSGLSNLVRTDGNPNLSMISMLIGAALNTVLDPIYIFIFNWGVKGAAIATITSQIISAIIVMYYFTKKSHMRIKKSLFKLDMRIVKTFTVLGIASSTTQIGMTVLQVILNNSLLHYGDLSDVGGDVALSAMGIVMKVSGIIISFSIGINIGMQPIIGFNIGAKKPRRVKETYKFAVVLASVIAFLGWIVCVFFPEVPLSLFGTGEENFAQFAYKCMRVYLMAMFLSGFIIISTGYFQATGQAVKASVLSMMRSLFMLVPLILILPVFFGLDGILYAGPLAEIISGVIVFFFVVLEMRKLNKQIAEENMV